MELWDIYDIDRVRTGRVAQRGKPASEGGLGEGEYHLVVHICVFNGHGQLLLQQRQKDKEGYPNLWDVSAAGSALAGENSAAAASRELREELSGVELVFIVGADAALTLPRWRKSAELAHLAAFAAATRPGFELGEQALRDLREHGFDVRPFAVPGLDISSSALRRRVYAGRTIRYLVPEAVRKIIEEESLYRRETDGGRVA